MAAVQAFRHRESCGDLMGRHAKFSVYARRLTPAEVAQFWFRRGIEFSKEIDETYPDFPKPGPDGLFLLSQVEAWFDRFHGKSQISLVPAEDEEEAAMRAARGQR
jgi:hypothetical protein